MVDEMIRFLKKVQAQQIAGLAFDL